VPMHDTDLPGTRMQLETTSKLTTNIVKLRYKSCPPYIYSSISKRVRGVVPVFESVLSVKI